MPSLGAILGSIALIVVIWLALHPKTQRKLDELDSKLIATDGKTVKLINKIDARYLYTGQPKGGHN